MSEASKPAFPIPGEQRYMDPIHGVIKPSDIGNEGHVGLTKRELFAAMALQGLVSDAQNDNTIREDATVAVNLADALLAALEKKNDT
jgi:hypothetical protein